MPSSASVAPFGYGGYEFKWSPSEKKLARKAFDQALKSEFDELIAETKMRASQIQQAHEVWELAEYLIDRRKQIDRAYDYRYSVLPGVLAALIKAGRLSDNELRGLHEDKLAEIRRLCNLEL